MDNYDAFSELGIEEEDLADTYERLEKDGKEAGIEINGGSDEPKKAEKMLFSISAADREVARQRALVPDAYKNSVFNPDKIQENLVKQAARYSGLNSKIPYKIMNFKKYLSVCVGILSALRMRQKPDRSFIIGAPEGFGKQSFVSECIITMSALGMKAAPYISLRELAELRAAEDAALLSAFKYDRYKEYQSDVNGKYVKDSLGGYKVAASYLDDNYLKSSDAELAILNKVPQTVTGTYSFSEYMNADCLFVFFSSEMSKEIESRQLLQVLQTRGAKGLPTIAMISTTLDIYKRDVNLRDFVWNEILEYDSNGSYSRVTHVSTYKQKNKADSQEVIDKKTGIVLGDSND